MEENTQEMRENLIRIVEEMDEEGLRFMTKVMKEIEEKRKEKSLKESKK
jgi:magnesium-transporting ATPase (P-type)